MQNFGKHSKIGLYVSSRHALNFDSNHSKKFKVLRMVVLGLFPQNSLSLGLCAFAFECFM